MLKKCGAYLFFFRAARYVLAFFHRKLDTFAVSKQIIFRDLLLSRPNFPIFVICKKKPVPRGRRPRPPRPRPEAPVLRGHLRQEGARGGAGGPQGRRRLRMRGGGGARGLGRQEPEEEQGEGEHHVSSELNCTRFVKNVFTKRDVMFLHVFFSIQV